MEEKMSGAPLPNARKVTPAIFCDKPRELETETKLGQRKSSAVLLIKRNRKNRKVEATIRGRIFEL
jgi:hypothetical protein